MFDMSIVDILKKHGKWIESSEFAKLVSEKKGVSERQAYRLIKKAYDKREISKLILPDRTVIYGLPEFGEPKLEKEQKISPTLSFKDAFLFECFKELEDISKESSKNPALGFNRLRLFISRLPEDLKAKLDPLTEEVVDIIVKKQNELEKQMLTPSERKPKLYALYFEAQKLLISKVSETLHKQTESLHLSKNL